ncbi:hypothetical protein SK128_013543 [Halocaridina rubra]|uniref:Fanconi anemia group A protein n=1 Tax=Halocaridina rubra TaxID=373956 RepID=A0AAN8WQ42_HALRR
MCDMEKFKSSLAKVVYLHIDISAMIREVGCDNSKNVVLEHIENHAAELDIPVSLAAKNVVTCQIKTVAEQAKKGQEYDGALHGILNITRDLMKRGILLETDLGEQLLCNSTFLSLPLTVLWKFKCIGVVSLEQIVKSIHDGKGGSVGSLLDDLINIILHKGQDPDSIAIAGDMLASLVSLSYNLDKEEYISLSKYSSDMLYSVTEHLLDYILKEDKVTGVQNTCTGSNNNKHINTDHSKTQSAESVYSNKSSVLNIYELLMNNLQVTLQALQKFCSSQLVYLLTFRPMLHVANVLKSQELWRSTNANPILSSLIQKLVIVVGYEAAIETLNTVVMNDEVNWGSVLTLVATVVNCHRLAVTSLKGIVESHIRQGCEEQDIESLVIGFIFARHASQEGRHLFPSYSQWFNALFATESGSPAATKQGFVFLVQFLTDLVPHEPAYCLRAHVTNQIYVPRGCQEVLKDYFTLARARLQDLNENFDGNMNSQRNLVEKGKVMKEVETCIQQFCQSGKIPNFILEASIFRKPYYLSSFLPILLTPRTLPDEPDPQITLVEALHNSGKIPVTMYKNYHESCQKVATDCSGVYINKEEEIVSEEPLKELSCILQELVTTSSVLPVLSHISKKIEEIMKPFDLKMKDHKYLILNVKMFNSKLIGYQVIEEFVSAIVKACLLQNEDNLPINRPDWLPQFLSLISASSSLQLSLFNYLLHNLEQGQEGNLSNPQMQIHGALLFEICCIEGLFLPVTDSKDICKNQSTFTSLYLNKLESGISTKNSCVFSCSILSYWLQWHMMSYKTDGKIDSLSTLPVQLVSQYCLLAPRVSIIRDNDKDEDLTTAHVYSLLEGYGVNECSKLYYDQIHKSPYREKWIPYEKWCKFELCASWQDTTLEVRLTYLQYRIQQDFVKLDDTQSSEGTRMSISEIISKMVFSLIEARVNRESCQNNYSEMLLLLQRLSHLSPDVSICLLEEWHKQFAKRPDKDMYVMSFMSICRCLPPSYFLPSKQFLQLSGPLEYLVELLKVTGRGLQLNLCDTTFICSCLINGARENNIKDVQIEIHLSHIRSALLFHADSVKSLFMNNIDVVQKHQSLRNVHAALLDPIHNASLLTPEEIGISLLSLCLKTYDATDISTPNGMEICRNFFVKWLLAYIGLQQMNGVIPLFLEEKDSSPALREQDMKVILTCRKELAKLLLFLEPASLVSKIFPGRQQTLLSLKMVPTACAYVVMSDLVFMRRTCNYDEKKDILEIKLFDLLLHSEIFIQKVVESQESNESDQKLLSSTQVNKQLVKENIYSTEAGYLQELNEKIFSLLSRLSSKTLDKLPESTITKCNKAIQSAIKYQLQCPEK